jgi:hypothetical protein
VTGLGASCEGLLKTELFPPQNWEGFRTNEFEPPHICPGLRTKELEKEIVRLEAIPRDHDTAQLIGILRFLKHVPTLRGFCEFLPDASGVFSDQRFSGAAIIEMHDTIYGRPRPDWEPMISSGHTKALPGGDECIAYRGEFHQLANAIHESALTGIPLVNDVPGLPVFSDIASPVGDADALAGLLSIMAMRLLLPELPVLLPTDLMEFREGSENELRSFRRAMISYAGDLNKSLDEKDSAAEIEKHAQFFVKTEIAPRLDELREIINKKSFGWIGRSAYKIVPAVGAGYLTGGSIGAIAALLTTGATNVPTDFRSSNSGKLEAKKTDFTIC